MILDSRRARPLVLAWATLCAVFLAAWAWHMTGHDSPDAPAWKPQALDFAAFWSAARLALQGQASALYDNRVIEAFERAHTALPSGYLAFYYPPIFLLGCLPLGVLPYLWAMAGFVLAQAVLLAGIVRRILGRIPGRIRGRIRGRDPGGSWGWLPVVAFPGFMVNLVFAQNGGFSAACFGGALLLLESRPLLAGACLGALAGKPQLAACVPVALLGARRFGAAMSCAATAVLLATLSLLAFGPGAWAGFLANAPMARLDIETNPLKWPVMQSVYAAMRLAGFGVWPAYAAHGAVAALALALLGRICLRRQSGRAEMAALAATALLFTPFLYIYDLTVTAVPLAWCAAEAARQGWRPGEDLLLLALYGFVPIAYALGLGLHIVIGPAFVLALLLLIERRGRAA